MDPVSCRAQFRALKSWRVKATDTEPERAFTTFVASTDVEDRYEDIIDQNSWRFANYEANPVILIDHYYSCTTVVGRGKDLKVGPVGEGDDEQGKAVLKEIFKRAAGMKGKTAFTITVEWDLADELARNIAGKVERGFLNAVSVGLRSYKMTRRNGLPKDHWAYSATGGYLLEENELYEVSVVAIPANAEALAKRAASAAGIDVDTIVRSVLERLAVDDELWRQVEARRLAAAASSAPTPAEDALPWTKSTEAEGDKLPWS